MTMNPKTIKLFAPFFATAGITHLVSQLYWPFFGEWFYYLGLCLFTFAALVLAWLVYPNYRYIISLFFGAAMFTIVKLLWLQPSKIIYSEYAAIWCAGLGVFLYFIFTLIQSHGRN